MQNRISGNFCLSEINGDIVDKNAVTKKFFLEPGYVCVPYEPMHLAAVIASGVVVTIYDLDRKRGGMCVYTHPKRVDSQSTASFAAPSIASLISMFGDIDVVRDSLEAHICGGAVNSQSKYFVPGLSDDNISVGCEILKKYNINIASRDVGGTKGRKIVFHSGTGEIFIAKVSNIRKTDWYPPYCPDERKKRESLR